MVHKTCYTDRWFPRGDPRFFVDKYHRCWSSLWIPHYCCICSFRYCGRNTKEKDGFKSKNT